MDGPSDGSGRWRIPSIGCWSGSRACSTPSHGRRNASHELRTPLTAAWAMLEMVISDPTRPPIRSARPASRCWRRASSRQLSTRCWRSRRVSAESTTARGISPPSSARRSARASSRRQLTGCPWSSRSSRLRCRAIGGCSNGSSRTWSRTRSATTCRTGGCGWRSSRGGERGAGARQHRARRARRPARAAAATVQRLERDRVGHVTASGSDSRSSRRSPTPIRQSSS